MAFRNISVVLTANDAQLLGSMRRSASSVDDFGRRVSNTARTSTRATDQLTASFSGLDDIIKRGVTRSMTGFVSAALGGYAAGRALNAAFQAVIGGAVQFDARMRNVNSISQLSERQLAGLSSQVLDLSRHLPQSANTLAEGLYDIASSGFQGAAGLIVLNNSARAATAGLSDTATSAHAITGVLNAYGLQAKDAKDVSDTLFQTVNLGVLNFNDLAQGIGQVVGTAAAAKVDIDQLGEAIATMTKGGIVPAEAFTSLNQVLAQIIQPSQALSQVFKQLGYESGASALETKGLAGVMDDIRRVTGGDVTALSTLFTDIRALRGVTALMTDQGRLYAETIHSWDAAHKGAGATAVALAEQMKSVAAQWQLFKNRAEAAAITLGSHLLPTMTSAISVVEKFGAVLANDGVRHAAEFALALYAVNKAINLVVAVRNSTLATSVFGSAASHTAAASAITAEGAAAVGTAGALGDLALAENAAAIAAGRLAVSGSIAGVAGAKANLEGAGTAMGAAMGANLASGFGRTASRLLTGIIGKVARGATIALAGELVGSAVGGTGGGIIKDIGFGAGAGSLFGPVGTGVGAAGGAAFGGTTALLHHFFGHNEAHPTAELNQEGQDLVTTYGSLDNALAAMKEQSREVADAQHQLGIEHKITAGSMEDELAALQQLQQARDQYVQTVQSSFSSSTDVISDFKPEAGAQQVASAQQTLLDAQRALRQEDQRYAAIKKTSTSSDITLANARKRVADATKALATAQHDAAQTGDLATVYRNNIREARQFVSESDHAIERGLDPQLVARLLAQGPEQAGPLLDAIVKDHSDRMLKLANTSEHALEQISARAIRLAQFTSRATLAPLVDQERLAKELPKALALDNLLRNLPAPATGAFLADKLGLGPKAIRRIAEDFGITLPAFIQSTLDRHPVHVRVDAPTASHDSGGRHGGFATGGQIVGPGSGTSDSVLIAASNGEWVHREAAVSYYGTDFMRAVNSLTLPRYASGGMVTSTLRTPMRGSSSGPVIVRVIERPTQHVVNNELNLHGPRFEDTSSWEAFEDRARARAAMP
jgi:TP901 family phage tail tape measure protein